MINQTASCKEAFCLARRAVNGKLIKVITVWQQNEAEDTIKFITLYPDKLEDI